MSTLSRQRKSARIVRRVTSVDHAVVIVAIVATVKVALIEPLRQIKMATAPVMRTKVERVMP